MTAEIHKLERPPEIIHVPYDEALDNLGDALFTTHKDIETALREAKRFTVNGRVGAVVNVDAMENLEHDIHEIAETLKNMAEHLRNPRESW